MRDGLARYGAVLASALLFSLYTRVEQPTVLLGWVALLPWLAALERERSMAAAVASAIAMSIAFTLGVFSWFAVAVARYTQLSLLLTFAMLVVAAPLLQPQFVFFAATRRLLAMRGRGRLVTGIGAACAYVGAEWLCPRLFGDTIGHGLLAFPTLRQGADLAGAAGLTFVLIAVNQCAYEALRLRRQDRRRALAAAALACVLIASLSVYGRLRIGQVAAATPASAPLTAALVQADLGDYEALRARLGTFDAVAEILERHEALSNEALSDEAFSNEALSNETVSNEAPSREARSGDAPSRHALEPSAGGTPAVDLLVWPETVYPTTFAKPKSADGAAFDRRIVEFTEHTHVPLLFGTYDRDGDREYNAAVLLQPDAQRSEQRYAVYRKKRLFPLTEELPAWLDRPFVRARLPWLGSWHGGDGRSTLTLQRRGGAALRIAPLVCLDAVDPGLAIDAARAGADLLVAMSNDGWFAGSRGARLHLIVSAFRSIETRLPQLRATNTGISAAISPTGEILARTALSKPAVLTASVQPGRRGSTLMLRWGDWFPPGAAAVALALVLAALTRRRPPAA